MCVCAPQPCASKDRRKRDRTTIVNVKRGRWQKHLNCSLVFGGTCTRTAHHLSKEWLLISRICRVLFTISSCVVCLLLSLQKFVCRKNIAASSRFSHALFTLTFTFSLRRSGHNKTSFSRKMWLYQVMLRSLGKTLENEVAEEKGSRVGLVMCAQARTSRARH